MYTDLMYLLHSVMASVEATRARVRLSNRVIPSSLSPAEQSRIGARVETLAAESIRRRLPPWQSKVLMFNIGVGQLDEISGEPEGGRPRDYPAAQWAAIWRDMDSHRVELRAQTEELENLIRSELSSNA